MLVAEADRCPHTKKIQSRRGCTMCICEEKARLDAEQQKRLEQARIVETARREAEQRVLREAAENESAIADFAARNPELELQLCDETSNDDELVAAHLVYADWLEDHGNPLAKLIRMQVENAPTAQIEQLLQLYPALTGQLREPRVKALGPVIDVDSVRYLEAARRDPLVEDLIGSCFSMSGPGVSYVTPPAQAFRVDSNAIALSRGFATRMRLFVLGLEAPRRILASPFAARLDELTITFLGDMLTNPHRVRDLIALLETVPAAPRLRLVAFERETSCEIALDRSRLPKLKLAWR